MKGSGYTVAILDLELTVRRERQINKRVGVKYINDENCFADHV